ncbi:hypothetical protein ZHAS_00008849 [Anopheles sinensis]|uniref:Uncharacterized protein n=1 Tax=Anopheles sinensis TaxID=74873 RepID=A0A084VTG5_ANOSI|nr:hypothetical protein ZHAS_00008849 [Anopheles sinensis]
MRALKAHFRFKQLQGVGTRSGEDVGRKMEGPTGKALALERYFKLFCIIVGSSISPRAIVTVRSRRWQETRSFSKFPYADNEPSDDDDDGAGTAEEVHRKQWQWVDFPPPEDDHQRKIGALTPTRSEQRLRFAGSENERLSLSADQTDN